MPFDTSGIVVNQISEAEILEFVDGDPSPRTDNMSRRSADLTIPFKIPGTKLIPFLQYCLGLSYVTQDAVGYHLARSLPMFHPIYTWAWADTVQVNGRAFRGDDVNAVVYLDQVTPAKWQIYQCLVTFSMPKYQVLADSAVTGEYQRFVSKENFPSVELASLDGGQVVFDATGKAWDAKPMASNQLIARRVTSGIKLTWHAVPALWVQADDNTLAPKPLAIQGCVNTTSFLGQAAETLLCKSVTLDKYIQPLETQSLGSMSFAYDITLELIQYNPTPKGKAGETRSGWNFFLGPDLQYYYATNATTSNKPFPTYEFADFFKHYSV